MDAQGDGGSRYAAIGDWDGGKAMFRLPGKGSFDAFHHFP